LTWITVPLRDRGGRPQIYCKPPWPRSEIRASLCGVVPHIGTAKSVLAREDIMTRLSSGSVAPSVITILSIALLCGSSGTAMSQTATGSSTQLPNVTVEAPRQEARQQRTQVTPQGPVGWYAERAGHRGPLKQRLERRRQRGGLSWRSLPGLREKPAVATMAANQASDTARTLGLDAANRRGTTQFSRQPAKTHSPTGTTYNA
jgi:hypothetical protein